MSQNINTCLDFLAYVTGLLFDYLTFAFNCVMIDFNNML